MPAKRHGRIASANADRCAVDRRIDSLFELQDHRGVSSGTIWTARLTGAERLQQFLVNAAEAAVRHDHDEIARPVLADDGAMMSSIESASRADWPRAFRSRTSCGTDSRSASGSVDRNTGAISTSSAPANARAKSS